MVKMIYFKSKKERLKLAWKMLSAWRRTIGGIKPGSTEILLVIRTLNSFIDMVE